MTPEERIERERLRTANDLLPHPAGNCTRGAHDECLHPVDCPCPCHDTGAFLTPDEHRAVRLAGDLWDQLCRTIPDGPTRAADLHELVLHIHALQHAVMSNAAARAYPDLYRVLGGSLRTAP